MRGLLLVAVLSSCSFPPAIAHAEGPWLIIPELSSEDDGWVKPTATKVRSELQELRVDVWSLDIAATRFEAEGSAPAAEVTKGDIERWAERSTAALRSLAEGDYETAIEQLSRAQELSLAATEELNREREGSRRVLDTCLYMVRALLETGSESRAEGMIQECRKLVPRGDPSTLMHPPAVIEMLERVDTSRSEQTGLIRVNSEPSGCSVRINGVVLGSTPFESQDLFPGRYRVQVECDQQRGRVHIADVIAGPTEMFVDLRFDGAIETDPLLYLRYPSSEEQQEHGVADAQKVIGTVPAGAVLLMSAPAPDLLELSLYRGVPLSISSVTRIPSGPGGPSRGNIALGVRALVEGRCTDFTGTVPSELRCGREAEVVEEIADGPAPPDRNSRRRAIAGWSLIGVGGASLVAGYVLMGPRSSVASSWVAGIDASGMSDPATQQKWTSMGTAIVATSSVGAASLVAAMPLVLPREPKVPWWAWLSGGLGVGALVTSAVIGSTVSDQGDPGTSCTSPSINGVDARICVRRAQRTDWAVLLGVTAAPLLTIPLTYLFRPKQENGRQHVQPQVEVHRAGGTLSFRGRF